MKLFLLVCKNVKTLALLLFCCVVCVLLFTFVRLGFEVFFFFVRSLLRLFTFCVNSFNFNSRKCFNCLFGLVCLRVVVYCFVFKHDFNFCVNVYLNTGSFLFPIKTFDV